ncbi:hypothetical protein [Microtetraspora malaysiensis]|uniref:hypothetical protein n=1 Tax=Microtetraspora malaysiensis TaxID=161358 RepID=UPI003D93BE1F
MPDHGDGGRSQDLLGRICERFEEIQAVIADGPDAAEGKRILKGLRAGENVARLEEELDRLLRRGQIQSGLAGITRGAGIGGLPGLAGHPVGPEVLVCPRGRCPRAVLPSDPAGVPRECWLHGEPMRPVRPGA